MDWIGQEPEWEQYLELWRFYQSGQFVDFMGLDEDWRDQSKLWPPPGDWKPCLFLDVEETVFQLTEIFEFAARLSLTEAGDEITNLKVATPPRYLLPVSLRATVGPPSPAKPVSGPAALPRSLQAFPRLL